MAEVRDQASARQAIEHARGESVNIKSKPIRDYRMSSARTYGNTTVSGHATAVQGDFHYHHHVDGTRQNLFDTLFQSLTFPRMDARLRNVAAALPTTCAWLVRHQTFLTWTDDDKLCEHHGFLWIKGKPGSGKSTIMKDVFVWAERTWTAQIVVSYFFNARSPLQLEKSSLGLYRSLVHQILRLYPASHTNFEKTFASKVKDRKVEEWTEMELQNFLTDLITINSSLHLTIFVDALDEGDDDDVRNMVAFFEELGERSTSASVPLRICFSSRHYPHITIERGLFMMLEDQPDHRVDIQKYIQSKLRGRQNPQTDELRQQILLKSAGIFLWVVLIVPVLNRSYDRGKGMASMTKELESLPSSLNQLFNDIVSPDKEDSDECIILLQWVLFMKKPLNPRQLYIAVQQTLRLSADTDQAIVEYDDLPKYLLHYSRGLVEIADDGYGSLAVQFIHETVRESLLRINIHSLQLQHMCNLNYIPAAFQAEACHIMIASACLNYLFELSSHAPQDDEMLREHPLATYVAEYWWQHLRSGGKLCSQKIIDLAVSLINGNSSHLLTWIRLCDIDSYGKDPRFWLKVEDLAPPLYYSALIGHVEVVSKVLLSADVNSPGGRQAYPLIAASSEGHEDVVRLLLDRNAYIEATGGGWFGDNSLTVASASGHLQIVRLLLDRGAEINARLTHGATALYIAADQTNTELVRLLVDYNADLNAQNSDGRTPLYAAAFNGNIEATRLLIDAGADVNIQSKYEKTALYVAVHLNHMEIARLLVNAGADINAPTGCGENILHMATFEGNTKVALFLIDHGADVKTQNIDGVTALYIAARGGFMEIVRLLLDHGADVNAQTTSRETALHIAVRGRDTDIVGLLLDRGADINALDAEGDSALQLALFYDDEEMARVLRAQGALEQSA